MIRQNSILLHFALCILIHPAAAQDTIPLWPNGAPDAAGNADADIPSLTVYLPEEDKATGTGIVICPGGGYGHLAMDHEGHQVAKWLNGLGVAAFILKYRHAPAYRHPTPLRDVQRAIRTVRSRAEEWGIGEGKLGVLGFSAGGHLAASAGMQFDWEDELADDEIGRLNARPDFMVLFYPVITMTEDYMHSGSRNNLLGEDADEMLAELMSHEKQVTTETPPAFFFHTTTDKAVPPENSIYLYLAMRKAGIDAEMHIYERGRHGVGLAHYDPVLSTWPAHCADWLRVHGFL